MGTHHAHDPAAVPSVAEHAASIRHLLLRALRPHTETVPLADALGRTTARAVVSPVDLPLFRNSQMDGFAVRSADLAGAPVTLPVAGVIAAAAAAPRPLQPGTAVRIMTGAVIPEGADAVVPVEATSDPGDGSVTLPAAVASGTFVRERGSDLRAGAELLPAGLLLAPRHLGALAAAGVVSVDVRRRPRIAILTTGSELVDVGARPAPGEIHDANAIALAAAVRALGAEVVYQDRVRDDESEFDAILAEAVGEAEIVITSGGISHGDFEVVRDSLEPLGAWIGHIAMQPGGPQALAVIDETPILCFPGNPVSTQLSFEVFVAPVLRELAGMPQAVREQRRLTADIVSPAGREQFLRARLRGRDEIEPVSGPGSHLVAALAASDALIDVPAETTGLPAGSPVEVWRL